MRESTVFGIEKPFPWMAVGIAAAISTLGLAAGCGITYAALVLGIGAVDPTDW